MADLFSLKSLALTLDKETRSLQAKFLRQVLDRETLLDLESVFNFCLSHLEINAICLSSTHERLGDGLGAQELLQNGQERLKENVYLLQKIILGAFHLPQTVIIDLGTGASGMMAELFLGADIRLAHSKATLRFNHLSEGLVPSCGAITLLGALTTKSFARQTVMSGSCVDTKSLSQVGLIHQSYEENQKEELLKGLLKDIQEQSPVQRIQAKRAFLEGLLPELEGSFKRDREFSWSGLVTGDWEEYLISQKEGRGPKFMTAKEMAKFLSEIDNQRLN